MYYFISLVIYILIIFILLYFKRHTNKDENKKYGHDFKEFILDQLEDMNIFSKKEREYKNKLSLKDYIIVIFGYILFIIGMLVIPVTVYLTRDLIINIPNNILFYEYDTLLTMILYFSSMMSSIIFSIMLKHLVDKNNLMEKACNEPIPSKSLDYIITLTILIIFFPLMILSLNTYRYVNDNSLIVKNMFSLKETTYRFEEFKYIEKKIYTNGPYDYIAVLKNDNKIKLCDDTEQYENIIKNIIDKNNIEIKINKLKAN